MSTPRPPFGAAKTYQGSAAVHVALVGAFPTEAEAGDELSSGLGDLPPYRGIWRLPEPFGAIVHVFTAVDDEELERANWTREAP